MSYVRCLVVVLAMVMAASCASKQSPATPPRSTPSTASAPVADAPTSQPDVWAVMDENGYELRMNETLNAQQAKLKLTPAQSSAIAAAKGAHSSAMKSLVQAKGPTLKAMIAEEKEAREAKAKGASEAEMARRRAAQQKYVREYVQQRDIERAYRQAAEAALTEPQRIAWHVEAIRPEFTEALMGKQLSADQAKLVDPVLEAVARGILSYKGPRTFSILINGADNAAKYVNNPADPSLQQR